jgi:hypothetical protein
MFPDPSAFLIFTPNRPHPIEDLMDVRPYKLRINDLIMLPTSGSPCPSIWWKLSSRPVY